MYPEKELGNSSKLCSGTKSFSPLQPHCGAATLTARILAPTEFWRKRKSLFFIRKQESNKRINKIETNLDKKDRQRGENVDLAGTEELVADLEKDVVRMLDLMADLMEDTDVLCAILRQAEAIAKDDMNCLLKTEDIRVVRRNNGSRV